MLLLIALCQNYKIQEEPRENMYNTCIELNRNLGYCCISVSNAHFALLKFPLKLKILR